MKFRSIISCGLLLLGVGAATTSCEDMFTPDNKLVTTELAPQDTLYQMMGIVKRMQKLADRTVLLGEIRADLVDVNPAVASVDVQQLSNNNISTNNVYNQPVDYYAVINSCNIYLANVDSLLITHGQRYYAKEICAAKCFRAWCYLELAKIYGNVPFVTEPVLTADGAEEIVASGKKAGMQEILDFCINDLNAYPDMSENDGLRPMYGEQTWNDITYDNMFIPVRVLLAELYLWRGSITGSQDDYYNAIGLYHDYLCFPNEERGVNRGLSAYDVSWYDREHQSSMDSYSNRYSLSFSRVGKGTTRLYEQCGVLPCDTVDYYGTTSDIRVVFNSLYANNYYPWVEPSQRLKDISAGQDYCFYQFNNANSRDTLYFSKDKNDYSTFPNPSLMVGDLRLYSNYNTSSNISASKYNSDFNDMKSTITKWADGDLILTSDKKNAYITYYRNAMVYLHLAEALNRAGFPETAYAVLAYGLANRIMDNRNIISQDEFDRLCEIKTRGYSLMEPRYNEDAELNGKTSSSFVIWPSNVFDVAEKNVRRNESDRPADSQANIMQCGIHSLGSGDTEFNSKYYLDDEETKSHLIALEEIPDTVFLPKKATAEDSLLWKESVEIRDAVIAKNEAAKLANAEYLVSPEVRAKRQARVAQLILDEEALEGMFEGHRFYDLMRYQIQEGKFNASAITLPEYIKATYDDKVNIGSSKWQDKMTGRPWYLVLPKR